MVPWTCWTTFVPARVLLFGHLDLMTFSATRLAVEALTFKRFEKVVKAGRMNMKALLLHRIDRS